MPDSAPPATAKMVYEASCPAHARTDVSAGDMELVMDHPESMGGTGLGMSPIQTYLAGFLGCTNSTIHKLAKKTGTEVTALDMSMEVEMDRRGLTMVEPVDLPFVSITTIVNITTPADDAQLAEMKEGLSQWCPIAVTFKAAGTDVKEVWNVTKP